MRLTIENQWDGRAAAPHERSELRLDVDSARGLLRVEVDAAFYGDPEPPSLPGPTPNLWHYEVVELFLFGAAERYFELELGPFGHYLALVFAGPRNVERGPLEIEFARPAISEGRWRGRALIPLTFAPERSSRVNAHALHGLGAARRYLSAAPALSKGARPDFHRADAAITLEREFARTLEHARHNLLEPGG